MGASNESGRDAKESLAGGRVARDRQEAIALHQRQLAPLMDELHAAGFGHVTLDELRTSRTAYVLAVPILVHWLSQVTDPSAKESIVRALSVPWAGSLATRALLDEFHRAPHEWASLKWAIGNAIEVIADPAAATEIVSIIAEPSHGAARQMFVLAVGRIGYRDSIPTLIRLLEDGDVAGHAVMALGKMAAHEAGPMLERLSTSGKPWVRKEAVKALKRIANRRA